MSRIGYSGRDFQIRLDGVVIAACRTKSSSRMRQAIDNTHEFGDGWRHFLSTPDQISLDVSVSGVATLDNYAILRNEWLGTSFSNVEIVHADGTTQSAEGAFLANLVFSGETQGFVAFEASFAFSGLISTEYLGATTVDVGVTMPSAVVAAEVATEVFSVPPVDLPTDSDNDPVTLPNGAVVIPGGVIRLTGDGGTNDRIRFHLNQNGIVDLSGSSSGALMSGSWGDTDFTDIDGALNGVGQWYEGAPVSDIGDDYDFRAEVIELIETVRQSRVLQFQGVNVVSPPDWRQMAFGGGIGSGAYLEGEPQQGGGNLVASALVGYEIRRRSDNTVMGRTIIQYEIDIT